MKDIFIPKVLPIISVVLLLASLFLFFKMKQNKVVSKTQNLLTHQFEATNTIFQESSNSSYQIMKEMSDKRPDDSDLTEIIEQIIQITEATKIELAGNLESNPSNPILNQIIHQYKTKIDTLLDQFARANAIVTDENTQDLKLMLYNKTKFSSLLPTPLKKTTVLNGLNMNAVALTRFFSSRVSGNNLIFDKFYPTISLYSRSLNTQTFKIYLVQPQMFSLRDLEIYCNNQPIPLVKGEKIARIPVIDNTPQTTVISANWTIPNYTYLSLSDTFSLTPSNY